MTAKPVLTNGKIASVSDLVTVNAAESLPPQPEQERCPYCRGTKTECFGNEYCYSTHWHEPLPVEAKDKERCKFCQFFIPNHAPTCFRAEPKPTPSTPSKMSTYTGIDILGKPVFQPHPDPSSITVEAKPSPELDAGFDAWFLDNHERLSKEKKRQDEEDFYNAKREVYIFSRAAWNAAKKAETR